MTQELLSGYRIGDPAPLNADGSIAWPAPDPSSVFFLHGPALISFSGGRTSALMLFLILMAHGGTLPDDVIVMFANTGREREETLRFVHECSVRWNVRILWVEWRPAPPRRKKGEPVLPLAEDAARRVAFVGFNSCDREGKWFAELIRRKRYLPNVDMRYCTEKLKVETMKWAMVALGYTHWGNVVGLRADEMHRVVKQIMRNASGKERWISSCPLARAGVVKRIVMRFWLGRNIDPRALTHALPQGFDLGLRDYEGNCDLCFLKGRAKKARIIRDAPWLGKWWSAMEHVATAATELRSSYMKRFDKRESVDQLIAAVEASPELSDFDDEDTRDYDVACGDTCIGDAETEEFDDGAIAWIMEQLDKAALAPVTMPSGRRAAPAAVADLFE